MHIPLGYALVLSFNIALYFPTLFYGLVIDDIEWYSLIRGGMFKHCNPLYRLYGAGTFTTNIFWDHATTLTLHTITAIIIATKFGIIPAFLWSAHPCNHQTAIWMTGRRYQFINITFLLCPWLLVLYVPFVIRQLRARQSRRIPSGVFTASSIARCIWETICRLSGLPKYSFLYPNRNTASYLPYSQPTAERYLSIPIILLCTHLPAWSVWILPIYAYRTLQLMPMYHSIQSFYRYHYSAYPALEKLALLKRLYKGCDSDLN